MLLADRIKAFAKLGEFILSRDASIQTQKFWQTIDTAHLTNQWVSPEFCEMAITSIAQHWLKQDKLEEWAALYPAQTLTPSISRRIGVVMAGNVPFVGLHDMLCVLVAGHHFVGKVSSKDAGLMQAIIDLLLAIEPRFSNFISLSESRLENFDAVIATGSDNTSRYFEYYFGKYPNIIRKNRHSIAVLSGNETIEEQHHLATDIFAYYGLGCRNVSKILVPKDYNLAALLNHFDGYKHLKNHNKYANNYEYHRAMYLMNMVEHLDTGFALIKPDENLGSPVGVIYYQHYSNLDGIFNYIDTHKEQLQCIVSTIEGIPNSIPFGQAQNPLLTDYADGIDTIEFLANL